AALNQRMSEGVTPENNAAVLLLKAFGPAEIPRDLRAAYFKLLAIEPLPDRGDYFVPDGEIIEQWRRDHPNASSDDVEKFGSQFWEAARQSWKNDESPVVAKWLAINEKPLNLLREATQREKCFFPLVADGSETPMMEVLSLYESQPVRRIAFCLTVRAMMKLGQRDTAGAWEG